MPFCLIRDVPGGGPAKGGKPSRGVTLNVAQLTVGSAPDQALHLPVAGVEPRHALITASTDGQLVLVVLSARGVMVNTRRTRKTSLWPGDRVQIGRAVITVEKPQSARLFVLRIEEPKQQDEQGREAAGHSISFWSWTFTIAVTVIFLLIPLMGVMVPAVGHVLRDSPFLPSDSLWNPGPLAAAHQSIGTKCDACHKVPFVPVRDQECGVCHFDVQSHVSIRSADISLFEGETCASCHHEHKQPAALVENDPRLCTDCHAHLEHLKPNPGAADVSDFGTDHPDFRVSVLSDSGSGGWHLVRLDRRNRSTWIEHSHLRFSHKQHLNPKGIKTPTGERVLQCQECHKPDPSGREFMPIRMSVTCIGCHSLRFDARDPSSVLPHGDLQAAFRTLQDHFAGEYLEHGPEVARPRSASGSSVWRRPGGSALTQTNVDPGAVAWIHGQAMKVARELMQKRMCVECHEIVHVPGATGFNQWRVRPVRLTSDWMPYARFDHAAHRTQTCISCHDTAERSEHATDILIPSITKCRECHGGVGDTTKVASSCLMCHQFHLPNHGALLKADELLAARSR